MSRAAILYELNQPLRVENIELPALKAGQVLVRVAWSGLCHSQINEIRGRKGEDKFLPHTLGHEGSGVVQEIGDKVTKVKPGDHVVLTWIKGTGADISSCTYRQGEQNINSGAISTFGTNMIVSENRLITIPKTIPLDVASLLGCAIPTGAGMVFHTLNPKPESGVAIFGVGGIGMSALIAATLCQCNPIIAVDVRDQKLELAKELGAHLTINPSRVDTVTKIREYTNGRGIDYAIEAAGRKEVMETAFRSIKDNGGLLVIAGNLPRGQTIAVDPYDFILGKRIVGTWGGEAKPDQDIPRYVEYYQASRLPLEKLLTHRLPLERINEAVAILENEEKVIRVLIKCSNIGL